MAMSLTWRAAAPQRLGVLNDFPDIPYYDCFLKTVIKLSDFAAHFIPRDKVEFTFDQHKETQYNAGLLYEWITAHKPTTPGRSALQAAPSQASRPPIFGPEN